MKTIYLFLLSITFAACSKKSERSNDRDAPLVNIATPVNDQSFSVGSTMTVTGTITDANRIVQVHYHFSSLETGQLLVDVHRYPGNSSFTMSEPIQISVTGQLRLQVIARDNAGNEGRQTIVVNGN